MRILSFVAIPLTCVLGYVFGILDASWGEIWLGGYTWAGGLAIGIAVAILVLIGDEPEIAKLFIGPLAVYCGVAVTFLAGSYVVYPLLFFALIFLFPWLISWGPVFARLPGLWNVSIVILIIYVVGLVLSFLAGIIAAYLVYVFFALITSAIGEKSTGKHESERFPTPPPPPPP